MTKEEKIVTDFLLKKRDSCPYVNAKDLSNVILDGDFDFTELVMTLTTYRAQVLEEVESKIIELEFNVRDSGEYGAGMYQAYEYAKDSVEGLKHPTN